MIARTVFLFLAVAAWPAMAGEDLTEARLQELAVAFIEAKNARQQPDTTEADVDHFIALLADSFVDEHVKYGVTVSDKAELRAGMVRKMADIIYYSNIDIDQVMVGGNVAIIKYTESAKVKPSHMDDIVEYSNTHIVTLEFDDQGFITHIRRHHGG